MMCHPELLQSHKSRVLWGFNKISHVYTRCFNLDPSSLINCATYTRACSLTSAFTEGGGRAGYTSLHAVSRTEKKINTARGQGGWGVVG